MGVIGKLGFIGRIKVWWKVLRDPRTPWWAKAAFVVSSVGYSLWPWDVVWDVPVLGWADDLIVVSFLAWLLTRLAPKVARHDAVAAVLHKLRGLADDGPNVPREGEG